jgi:signal transduction histidine kinase
MLGFSVSRFHLNSLRARLLAFVLLLIIPMALLIAWNAAERRRHDLAEAEANALRIAQLAASTQEQTISAARELLITLARDPDILERNAERCSAYFADLIAQSPQYSNLSVVDIDGMNFFCSAIPANPGVNVTDRAWFRRALTQQAFVIGDFIVGRTTNVPSISFATPVVQDEVITGIAVVSASLEWLSGWVGQVELPADSTLTVLDNNGIILARYPYEPELIGQAFPNNAAFEQMVSRAQGTYEDTGRDGIERLYGFTRLEDYAGYVYIVVGLSKAVVLAPSNALQTFSLVSLALTGSVLLTIILWVANRVVIKPIGNLIHVTDQLAQGDLTVRPVLVDSFEELDRLALHVQQLARSLEQRQQEVQAEIDTRKQTELHLRTAIDQLSAEVAARKEAEEANNLKLKFLGMISHELRTPLASIKGFSTTLLAPDVAFPQEQQHQFLTVIDQQTDKLSELVEQLLDLSRLQSGTLRIESSPQTLETILKAASTHVETLAAQHQLTFQIPSDLPQLLADSERIAQVIVNLIGNAAKFSPASTPIVIQATVLDGHVQIDVADQGIGIPLEERAKVFEAFQQVNRKTPGQRRGAGLGLAICKSIIEAHGGRIWIQDRYPGTTVSFLLPIVASDKHHLQS